jgi:hypothetical protein
MHGQAPYVLRHPVQIDENGDGKITFDEFCEWAITNTLLDANFEHEPMDDAVPKPPMLRPETRSFSEPALFGGSAIVVDKNARTLPVGKRGAAASHLCSFLPEPATWLSVSEVGRGTQRMGLV